MKYTAIIVDDEDYARGIIRSLLSQDSSIQILCECSNGTEAVVAIKSLKPQIVFLDIQMPEVNGFQVIERTKDYHSPQYIFTTAYDEYALKAFEVNALDYLLKPFDDSRFLKALHKVKEKILNQDNSSLQDQLKSLIQMNQSFHRQYLQRISIKIGGKIRFIPVEEVEWLEADNQYVQVHSKGVKHIIRESLTQLEANLDPSMFVRIHRSSIVNVASISSLEPHFKGDYIVRLKDDTKLKLAHSRKERLKEVMGW